MRRIKPSEVRQAQRLAQLGYDEPRDGSTAAARTGELAPAAFAARLGADAGPPDPTHKASVQASPTHALASGGQWARAQPSVRAHASIRP